jgi:hypothetical protein
MNESSCCSYNRKRKDINQEASNPGDKIRKPSWFS